MSLILIPTCFSALRLSRYFTYLISPHSPSSPRLLSPPHLASSLLFSSFLANQLLSTFNSMIIPHIVLAKNRKMRLKLPPVTCQRPDTTLPSKWHLKRAALHQAVLRFQFDRSPTVILYRTFLSWASQDCSLTSREPKVRAFFFWEWFN